jgi:hypothetical protein
MPHSPPSLPAAMPVVDNRRIAPAMPPGKD